MKEKHLEFTQNIINRMAQNSFMIKGWTVTLVSALAALSANESDKIFMLIAYIPTIAFWLLDAYYLYQERLFRTLYNKICTEEITNYSLNTRPFDKGWKYWVNAALSKTIILFYLVIIMALSIIMWYYKK